MRWTDPLSRPQKIVVVIALGVACGAAGTYLVNLGNTVTGGWYAYAPLPRRFTRRIPDWPDGCA